VNQENGAKLFDEQAEQAHAEEKSVSHGQKQDEEYGNLHYNLQLKILMMLPIGIKQ
jgi:hypothetical protein